MPAIHALETSSHKDVEVGKNDKKHVYAYEVTEKPEIGTMTDTEATDLAIEEIEKEYSIDSENSPFAEVISSKLTVNR